MLRNVERLCRYLTGFSVDLQKKNMRALYFNT